MSHGQNNDLEHHDHPDHPDHPGQHEAHEPVRVAVANDYPIIVRGIVSTLNAFPQRTHAVPLSRHTDYAEAAKDVDVVLIDPFGSRRPGWARLEELPHESRRKAVVLSWHRSATAMEQAFEAGCGGYLSKRLDATDLVAAIEAVHRGQRVVSPESAWTQSLPRGQWPGQDAGLTARESELLCLIAQGLTNDEVAQRAYIGKESLKKHVRSAYRKIGVTRRSEAIVWCLNHGLAPHD